MKRTLMATLLFAFSAAVAWGQDNVQKNLEYAVHDGVSLVGLVFAGEGRGASGMLFIHGGGFARGSKAGYGNTWDRTWPRVDICVCHDYRLSMPTQATWPQALLDCKAALQYLRGRPMRSAST